MKEVDIIRILPENYVKNYIKINPKWITTHVRNQFRKSVNVKRFFLITKEALYNLGLWSGDKYVYGGTVGLTNTEKELINEFKVFLKNIILEKSKIVIKPINDGKALKVQINSWLLLRILRALDKNRDKIISTIEELCSYLSGKIDADGTIMPKNLNYKTGLIKITYESEEEAKKDSELLNKFNLNASIIPYKDRNAFDLKLTFKSSIFLLNKLQLKHPKKKNTLSILCGRLARR
jgi:hypothetical protein